MFIRCLLAAAIVLVTGLPTFAWNPLLDPVTRFTNGMSLPSSDPMRSHNVYWQCDPYRIGCCGGHYNCPCVKFGLFPNSCCTCQHGTEAGDCRGRVPSLDGIEEEGVTTLGAIPAPTSVAVGGSAGPPGVRRAGPGSPSLLQGMRGR